MEKFSELNLPEVLKRALEKMEFVTPTPIQAQAIPFAMEGRDVLGCAQTGTGKTAAFAIPMLVKLLKDPRANGLVLVPTRELAAQVTDVIEQLTHFTSQALRPVLVIGGTSMNVQVKKLRARPRLIVATPGRLVDHLNQRTASLESVQVLVLDEADRMLDIGFEPQLRRILSYLPTSGRQTMMFSATISPDIQKLSNRYLTNPEKVSVAPSGQTKAEIEQSMQEIDHRDKNEAMLDVINAREGSMLVFARTKSRTDRLARYLDSYGVEVARIHGGRSQAQRTGALDAFRDGKVRVLVATDVAARGIDIDHVAHVVNFDLPMVAEDYVHRIGRTGRNGRSGKALSFVTREERAQWTAIIRLLGKTGGSTIKQEPARVSTQPRPEPTQPDRPSRHPQGQSRWRNGGGGQSHSQPRAPQAHNARTPGNSSEPVRPHVPGTRQRFRPNGGGSSQRRFGR